MLSELGRYRLNAVTNAANQTADVALESEAQARAKAQAETRRAAVARVVGGFNPIGSPDQVYGSMANTMTGLLGVGGEEAQNAANIVSKTAQGYHEFHPQFAPRVPQKPVEDWLVDEETQVPGHPSQRAFGGVPHVRIRKYIDNKATDMFDYKPLGSWHEPSTGGSGGLSKQEEAFKERLEKEEQQLFGQVKANYQDVDLDAIAAGEAPVPTKPGTEETQIVYDSGPNGERIAKIVNGQIVTERVPGSGTPDPVVAKWVGALKAKEDWYKTHKLQSSYQNRYGGVAIGAGDAAAPAAAAPSPEPYNPYRGPFGTNGDRVASAKQHLESQGFESDDASVQTFLKNNPKFK